VKSVWLARNRCPRCKTMTPSRDTPRPPSYAELLSRVLHTPIVRYIESLRRRRDAYVVVTGRRAFNAYVSARRRIKAVAWTLSVVHRSRVDPVAFEEKLGRDLAEIIAATLSAQSSRVDAIERELGVPPHPRDVRYRRSAGTVGVRGPTGWLVMARLSRVDRRDRSAVGLRRPIDIGGILYEDLFLGAETPPRLVSAAGAGELSCNVYRDAVVKQRKSGRHVPSAVARRMEACVAATQFGPLDRAAFPHASPDELQRVRSVRRRFGVHPDDAARHAAYIRGLPSEMRRALARYTGNGSAEANLALVAHFSAPPRDRAPLPRWVRLLQKALLGAPKLRHDAEVFKVSRFILAGGRSNYDFRVGEAEPQPVFNSTTADNQLNLGAFVDEFAPCCGFRIRLPRGSRGALAVLGMSSVPKEAEVLLPFGCALRIDAIDEAGNVTYVGPVARPARFVYASMRVYIATYLPPLEGEEAVPDVPYVDAVAMRSKRQLATVERDRPHLAGLARWLLQRLHV
jgi:hypothetical protein